MLNFDDVVSTKISKCSKCYAILYTLPCNIDSSIAEYLQSFGSPLYPLHITSLLRINIKDNFYIEGRVGTKLLKFSMPKQYENVKIASISEKNEFDKCLLDWIEHRLGLYIER